MKRSKGSVSWWVISRQDSSSWFSTWRAVGLRRVNSVSQVCWVGSAAPKCAVNNSRPHSKLRRSIAELALKSVTGWHTQWSVSNTSQGVLGKNTGSTSELCRWPRSHTCFSLCPPMKQYQLQGAHRWMHLINGYKVAHFEPGESRTLIITCFFSVIISFPSLKAGPLGPLSYVPHPHLLWDMNTGEAGNLSINLVALDPPRHLLWGSPNLRL